MAEYYQVQGIVPRNGGFVKSTAIAVAMLSLWGCAAYDGTSLRAGVSTEAEARTLMGAPAAEYAGEDGTRRLAYPRGPMGTQTFIVSVGADGRVQGVGNVLTDGTFNRIQPGMTEPQILAMIGPPGDTMHFSLSNSHAWDYRYMDTWGYPAIFSVTFDAQGKVLSKFSRRIERGSNSR
jgi:hypothetical protein